MKTERWNYKPTESSLFMPLLAVLPATHSLVWLGILFMGVIVGDPRDREVEFPLRLLSVDERAQVLNPVTSPSIIIEREEVVMPKNYVYDHAWVKNLRHLRARIPGHLTKRNAEKIVIYVEPDVLYEQLIDVLNSFSAYKSSQYQITFLPPLCRASPR